MPTKAFVDYHGHQMAGSESLLPGEFALRYAQQVAMGPSVSPKEIEDLSDELKGRIDELRKSGRRAVLADMVVSNSGDGQFSTIQGALTAAARRLQTRVGKFTGDTVIYIAPGYYDEAPTIPAGVTGDIVLVSLGEVINTDGSGGDATATFWAGGAIITGILTIGASTNIALVGLRLEQGINSTTSLSSNSLQLDHCWVLRTDGAEVINNGVGGDMGLVVLDHCYVSSTADLLDSTSSLRAHHCILSIRSFHATASTGANYSLSDCLLLGGAAGVAMFRPTNFNNLHVLRTEIASAGGLVNSGGTAIALGAVTIMNSRFFLAASQTAITLTATHAVITGNRFLGNLTTARGTGITFTGVIANSNAIVQGNLFQGLVTGVDGGSALNTAAYNSVIGPNAYSSNTTNYTGVAAAVDYQVASGAFAHALLSGGHSDALAGTVTRGDIIVGNTTPAWAELATGAAGSVFRSDGTDPAWTINPTIAGYTRIGATAAPANVTAGDLTFVRGFVNNDSNFLLAFSGALPRITVDSGDFIDYDRVTNSFVFNIASVVKLTIANTLITVGVDGSAPALVLAAVDGVNEGGELQLNGAAANIDWTHDNSAGNLRWFESATVRMALAQGAAGGLRVVANARIGSETAPSSTTAGDLTAVRLILGTDIAIPASTSLYINTGGAAEQFKIRNTSSGGGTTSGIAIGQDTVGDGTFQNGFSQGLLSIVAGGGAGGQIVLSQSPGFDQALIRMRATRFDGIVGGMRWLQFIRIGSASVDPTNITDGDLTCVRLNVGNVAFGTGVEAVLGGDATLSGFLRVGSNTAPTNTTAGDLASTRVLVGTDATFPTNVAAYLNLVNAADLFRVDSGSVQRFQVGSGTVQVGVDGSAPTLTLAAVDGTNEGGEMVINGAAANADWTFDNNTGNLRLFTGGAVYVQIEGTIADTETALTIRRDLAGVESTQRVTQGTVDSGGTGFRLLRVPN